MYGVVEDGEGWARLMGAKIATSEIAGSVASALSESGRLCGAATNHAT